MVSLSRDLKSPESAEKSAVDLTVVKTGEWPRTLKGSDRSETKVPLPLEWQALAERSHEGERVRQLATRRCSPLEVPVPRLSDSTSFATLVACILFLPAAAAAQRADLPSIEQANDTGRYSFDGFHDPSDTEYRAIVGVGGSRSFFVFDLSTVTDPRPVAAATLELVVGGVTQGGFGGIDYTLYDVTTPIPTLVAGGSGLVSVYTDLGTGTAYSALTAVDPADAGNLKSIPLLAAGVAAVEAAKGGQLAIGGSPTGLSGNFAFSGTDVTGAKLLIEFQDAAMVPALSPGAITLLAGLLAGMGFVIQRIHQQRGQPLPPPAKR